MMFTLLGFASEWTRLMYGVGRKNVRFELAASDGEPLGSVQFELLPANDSTQSHVHNFLTICQGTHTDQYGRQLCYAKTQVHAVNTTTDWLLAGDVINSNGTIWSSALVEGLLPEPVFDPTYPCQAQTMTYDRPPLFLVADDCSMYGSQLLMGASTDCVKPAKGCLLIGQLKHGADTLRQVQQRFGTSNGKPKQQVFITKSMLC